jgi:hypothetical protein
VLAHPPLLAGYVLAADTLSLLPERNFSRFGHLRSSLREKRRGEVVGLPVECDEADLYLSAVEADFHHLGLTSYERTNIAGATVAAIHCSPSALLAGIDCADAAVPGESFAARVRTVQVADRDWFVMVHEPVVDSRDAGIRMVHPQHQVPRQGEDVVVGALHPVLTVFPPWPDLTRSRKQDTEHLAKKT